MPIVFEEVTGEVAPARSESSPTASAPAPDSTNDLREKLLCELALLQERKTRLFAD
ncbi:MAG TPA: hypothetical protein VFW00_02520 [Rhodocyclaceae bacterium]|nr:hypothetical protein [Rhodocyclaceae bacterium]